MVAKELQKRNGKAKNLRVLQTDDGQYYVESAEGKILYRCIVTDDSVSCTCGDFVRNIKNNPQFYCKHLLAVKNCASTGEVENGQFLDKIKPRLDERFIINIKGKDFVVYNGLLDLGHQKGIQSLRVETIQLPTKENGMEAISKATLESKLGEIYEEIGCATPANVNRMVVEHLLHMSATRAKARVLRDYTNAKMTAWEELGNPDDIIGADENTKTNSRPAKKAAPKKVAKKKQAPAKNINQGNDENHDDPRIDDKIKNQSNTSQEDNGNGSSDTNENPMSEAQKRAIMNLSRRRGISVEDLEKMCQESYGMNFAFLNTTEASSFIRTLQTAA